MTDIEGALILGTGAGEGDSLMDIVGMSGVTDMAGTLAFIPLRGAGVSLTEMVGIGGVTPIDGTFAVDPRWGGLLTEMDGVSEMEIDGRGDAEEELKRVVEG